MLRLSYILTQFKSGAKLQNYISFGISLPRDIIEEIDNERGDIPRSRYILRILQRGYILKKVRNGHKVDSKIHQESLESGFESLQSSESKPIEDLDSHE